MSSLPWLARLLSLGLVCGIGFASSAPANEPLASQGNAIAGAMDACALEEEIIARPAGLRGPSRNLIEHDADGNPLLRGRPVRGVRDLRGHSLVVPARP